MIPLCSQIGLTFNQYCILATIGFSDRKVKSFRFQVNGIGTIKLMNSAISNTRSMKTCKHELVSTRHQSHRNTWFTYKAVIECHVGGVRWDGSSAEAYSPFSPWPRYGDCVFVSEWGEAMNETKKVLVLCKLEGTLEAGKVPGGAGWCRGCEITYAAQTQDPLTRAASPFLLHKFIHFSNHGNSSSLSHSTLSKAHGRLPREIACPPPVHRTCARCRAC